MTTLNHWNRRIGRSVSLFVVTVAALSGCGSGKSELSLAPVEGRVTLKGSPVPGALVQFSPGKGPSSVGYTDESGAFTLMSNEQEGAIPSTHSVKVTLGLPKPPELNTGAAPQEVPVSSKPPTDYVFDATVTVESGMNTISLELSDAKKRQG
jgi:hypothetical protein